LFESVQDNFRIRMIGFPDVSTQPFELRANLRMIVNLTVKHQPQAAILICHRLSGAFRQVNDGKSTVAQPYAMVP
jgi:hypothetical protein